MANNHPRGETHQHQRLVERFDHRAVRLRGQANVFLAFIIAVLVLGVAFLLFFANDIARLNLQTQTAEAQSDKVTAAIKENQEQVVLLDKKRFDILNGASIRGPWDEKISEIKQKYDVLENNILQRCGEILFSKLEDQNEHSFKWTDDLKVFTVTDPNLLPSKQVSEYGFVLPEGKLVSFQTVELANECLDNVLQHRDEITRYTKEVEDLQFQESRELQENRKNKEAELAQLNSRIQELQNEKSALNFLLGQLKPRIVQEKLKLQELSLPLNSEAQADRNKTEEKIDWARVIETNATRIGALVTMFFLVTILVPQYRYNVRMANFYQARSDSFGMLPEQMSAEDFDKVVNIMTPNIDFGKAPPTPWEQIIEVIKTAKS
jgi:hypothetical protein